MNGADGMAPDAHKGYSQVEDQANLESVLDGMDATATWPSVQYLRTWTNERLDVGSGDRLLDVGCGLFMSIGMFAVVGRKAAPPTSTG